MDVYDDGSVDVYDDGSVEVYDDVPNVDVNGVAMYDGVPSAPDLHLYVADNNVDMYDGMAPVDDQTVNIVDVYDDGGTQPDDQYVSQHLRFIGSCYCHCRCC